MKITAIFLLVGAIHVSAAGISQTITFSGANVPLKQVFNAIEKQTGYHVFYTSKDLQDAKKISVDAISLEIADFLHLVLNNQRISFTIKGKTVFIRAVVPDKISSQLAAIASAPPVTGIVRGPDGQPIAGANVVVKGTKRGTVTDAQGRFSIEANGGDVIVVSSIGFAQKEIKLDNTNNNANVVLAVSESKLDEVQIIAYGTTSKRLITGNIGGISSKEIEKTPVGNPLLALSGRVPGIFISQNTGFSGSGVSVNIQGLNSITKGNDPFYVIDGVPYTSLLLPTFNGILGGRGVVGTEAVGQGSPFNFLNPADIESINILKDADATAIYGSRAANGAIIITTKRGKAGQTQVDITAQQGQGKVGHKLNMLNTQQYLEMRKEAYANEGEEIPSVSTTPDFSNFDLTIFNQDKHTDWQKELIGGSAKYTDIQVAVSGGTNNTFLRLNGGYHRETTVFPGNFSDLKGSVGASINHASSDNKFNLQFSGNYLQDNNNLPSRDLTSDALTLAPNSPSLYTSTGTINWQRILMGTDSVSTWENPLGYLNNQYKTSTKNLISNASISYAITNHLIVKTSLGYSDLIRNEIATYPFSGMNPDYIQYSERTATYSNGKVNSWIIEPQVSYNLAIAKGRADFLVGTSFQEMNKSLQRIAAEGFNSDEILENYSSASKLSSQASVLSKYKYNAIFGRLNYNWQDKYILNFTIRRDGSSRFGSANQFNNFSAVGAAWIFSNENFLRNHISLLSFGKIRASYGTTGNDQIGDYGYINQYVPVNTISAPNSYQGIVGLEPIAHPNPYLQWELTKKLQAGIDLGFLRDRILIGANYYRNRSSNQLLNYALPYQSGFEGVLRNFPATVQNAGWELSINTTNLKNKIINWTTSINVTWNKNKLQDFPNLATSTYANLLTIGNSITARKVYSFAGVNSETGLFQFYTADNKIVEQPNEKLDRTIIVDPTPKYYGGIANTLSYKDFELSILFQFVKQEAENYKLGGSFLIGGLILNEPTQVLDRWRRPGDQTNIQKYSTSFTALTINAKGSNFGYADASYIRLKNTSLSYTLPSKFLNSIKIQRLRLFVQAQNLLTFTKYIGLDPENASSTRLPPLKVITFGLQVSL